MPGYLWVVGRLSGCVCQDVGDCPLPGGLMRASVGALHTDGVHHQYESRPGQAKAIQGKLKLVSSDLLPLVILVARFMRP